MPTRAYPLSLLALLLVACGPKEPPKPGTLVTYDDFCDAKYDLPEGALADTPRPRMSLEGYLVPPKMFSLCSTTCSFDLVESLDEGARSVRYSVTLGDEPNELAELPENFEAADFKLRTQGNEIVTFGDKVRLTGERLGDSKDQSCQLYKVDLVEKAG